MVTKPGIEIVHIADKHVKVQQPKAGDSEHLRGEVPVFNVFHSMEAIRKDSEVLRTVEKSGKLQIHAVLCDVCSGRVGFL